MQTRMACALTAVALVSAVAPAAAPPAGADVREVRALLRRLDHDSFRTRQAADEALRAMGKAVLPALRAEQARTASREVRHRLTVMIRDLTIDERIGQLLGQLVDGDAQVRASADYALRQAGAGVVPLLRRELRPGLDREQRRRVERIIAELSPTR